MSRRALRELSADLRSLAAEIGGEEAHGMSRQACAICAPFAAIADQLDAMAAGSVAEAATKGNGEAQR